MNGYNHIISISRCVSLTPSHAGASAKGRGWTSAGWITHGPSLSASLMASFGAWSLRIYFVVYRVGDDYMIYMPYVRNTWMNKRMNQT